MQPDRQVQRILCERYPYGQAGGCFVGFGSENEPASRERSHARWRARPAALTG
jgi:hypothetical protein